MAANIPDSPIISPAAWFGAEQAKRTDWIYKLSDSESVELAAAIRAHRAKGEPLTSVRSADYPLERLWAENLLNSMAAPDIETYAPTVNTWSPQASPFLTDITAPMFAAVGSKICAFGGFGQKLGIAQSGVLPAGPPEVERTQVYDAPTIRSAQLKYR
jgi:hypothetical protein